MKRLMTLGYVAIIVAVFMSCSEEEVLKSTNVKIADDQSAQVFWAYDAKGVLSFVATESWTATPTVNWISLAEVQEDEATYSTEDGISGEAGEVKLALIFKANTTGKIRKGNITIKTASGAPEIVTIEQRGELNIVRNVASFSDPTKNTLAKSLQDKFGEGYEGSVKSVKVQGSMNSADFVSLLGFETVDISEVDIVGPILVHPLLDLMEDAIPFSAFVQIDDGTPGPNQTLKSIFLPNEVTHVGVGAFALCTELVDVTMPSSLEVLMIQSFFKCGKLKNINSWGKLKAIEEDVFKDCVSFDTIVLPNTLETLGNSIFPGSYVKKVVLPESLVTMGTSVFASCPELAEVELPTSLSLNASAQLFQNCPKLRAITLSGATTVIPMNFATSSGIETLDIPVVVTSIDRFSFADCKELKTIKVNWTEKGAIPTITALDNQEGHSVVMDWVGEETLIGSFPEQYGVNIENDYYITVPKGTIELYQAVEGWESYKLQEEK